MPQYDRDSAKKTESHNPVNPFGVERDDSGYQNMPNWESYWDQVAPEVMNADHRLEQARLQQKQAGLDLNLQTLAEALTRLKLSSTISVPIGRNIKLKQDIQDNKAELNLTRENIRKLKTQIAQQGGTLYAPHNLDVMKESEEKKERNLELIYNALVGEHYLQSRYETELCAFALLRGELAIAKGNSYSRNDVFALANRLYPNLFDQNSVLLGLSPKHLSNKFDDVRLIDSEIKKLQAVISAYPEAKLLTARLESLLAAKQSKQGGTNQSEDEFEFYNNDVNLPRFSDDISSSFDLGIGENWYLRISVVPTSTEIGQDVNDAIVFRENYPTTTETVHIAITYYKPWNLGQFSLSSDPDLMNTMLKFKGQLCQLCKANANATTSDYRLPTCTLFLRFYNESEQFEDRFKTSGLLHIPVCRALNAQEMADTYENVLNENGKLYNCSVPDWMFAELFKRQMLGSNWINSRKLWKIYDVLKSDIPNQVGFIIHSQIYRKDQ